MRLVEKLELSRRRPKHHITLVYTAAARMHHNIPPFLSVAECIPNRPRAPCPVFNEKAIRMLCTAVLLLYTRAVSYSQVLVLLIPVRVYTR